MILCLCQRGNVRSATLMTMLRDLYGLKNVIATGVETTDPDILTDLALQSDQIFVVGDNSLIASLPPVKYEHIDIGPDRWLHPMHPDLIRTLIEELIVFGFPRPANADWYIEANANVIRRVYGELK